MTDLENNKIFLLNKNKEIEEQINNLQNLAKKVNYIYEKNFFISIIITKLIWIMIYIKKMSNKIKMILIILYLWMAKLII